MGGPYRGSHGKIAHLEVYQNKAYSGPLLGYYWSSRVSHLGPLFWPVLDPYFDPIFGPILWYHFGVYFGVILGVRKRGVLKMDFLHFVGSISVYGEI